MRDKEWMIGSKKPTGNEAIHESLSDLDHPEGANPYTSSRSATSPPSRPAESTWERARCVSHVRITAGHERMKDFRGVTGFQICHRDRVLSIL